MYPIPKNEKQRIVSLYSMNLLDTPSEDLYDRIVNTAKIIFDVPIVFVCLIDSHRQWFKSKTGMDVVENPRGLSFCAHAICQEVTENMNSRLFEVPDATEDSRFCNNPLVTNKPNIKYYLGFVLQSSTKHNVGTFSIVDTKERTYSWSQIKAFCELGYIVQELINGSSSGSRPFGQQSRLSSLDRVLYDYDKFKEHIGQINSNLSKEGLNFVEWRILNIAVKQETATPALISNQLSLSRPLVSIHLRKLEEMELIVRKASTDNDRRFVEIICSELGYSKWFYGVELCRNLDFTKS